MSARPMAPPDLVSLRRSLLWDGSSGSLWILDQTLLPHEVSVRWLPGADAVVEAIATMRVRGAPLIGVCAAFGLVLAARQADSDETLEAAAAALRASRPTAVNLPWAVGRMLAVSRAVPGPRRPDALLAEALAIDREEVERSRRMGAHGMRCLLETREARTAGTGPLQILTHCNTGWLATVGSGTALAVVYEAQAQGVPVHVWVDETRPRAQGAKLTTWELQQAGIPCTLLADVAAGHLLRTGEVDAVLVGCDRATAAGDVCNKVGTYPLALAARDNQVPCFAVLPVSSVDWEVAGPDGIPVERRDGSEVTEVVGLDPEGRRTRVRVPPDGVEAVNFAFDVTPARLLTGLVTEHGVFPASPEGMRRLLAEERAGLQA